MLDIWFSFTVKRKKTANITVFRKKMWYYKP